MSGLGLTFLRRGGLTHPTAGNDYIKFKDEAVFNVLMSNGVSADGVGITKDDALKVTNIAQWFRNNASIVEFEELKFFANATSLAAYAFNKCTSLTILDASNVTDIGDNALTALPLQTLVLNYDNIKTIGTDGLRQLTCLPSQISLPSLTSVGRGNALRETNVEYVLNLGTITSLPAYTFFKCANLKQVHIPSSCTSIDAQVFANCKVMEAIVCHNPIPPSTHAQAFMSTNSTFLIYVPDASVDAYKAADTWSGYASRIKPLSEYQG